MENGHALLSVHGSDERREAVGSAGIPAGEFLELQNTGNDAGAPRFIATCQRHAELWRWKGPTLNGLNGQYGADDTRSQRTSSTSNPLNPSATTANDPDYIRLAEALPEP